MKTYGILKTYGTMYYVADMAKAVAFYKSVLGVTPTHESPDWTEFSIGGHSLCLHGKRADEAYTENGILIFNVDHVKQLFSQMQGDGLNVFALHEVHPAAWAFHLKDADGNETSYYGTP